VSVLDSIFIFSMDSGYKIDTDTLTQLFNYFLNLFISSNKAAIWSIVSQTDSSRNLTSTFICSSSALNIIVVHHQAPYLDYLVHSLILLLYKILLHTD